MRASSRILLAVAALALLTPGTSPDADAVPTARPAAASGATAASAAAAVPAGVSPRWR